MNILIVDAVCYKPYDFITLNSEALGGTEATVLRVAEALSKNGNSVSIMQHNREVMGLNNDITFCTMDTMIRQPDAIIHLRTARQLPVYQEIFPGAKQFIWLHDLTGSQMFEELPIINELKPTLLFVSQFAKGQFIDYIGSVTRNFKFPKMRVIHNIVDDRAFQQLPAKVPGKCIFFSSPHKGLERTKELFAIFKEFHMPHAELVICNPGYFEGEGKTLSFPNVMEEVASSELVFYPNAVFPETFGLVLAEANAAGTPVLTHAHGAASEILQDQSQLVDCNDNKKFIDKALTLINNKYIPDSSKMEKFKAENIVKVWEEVLNEANS